MPKILFSLLHRPGRSPSQRFRFEQYLNYLIESGFNYDFSYLINERDDDTYYASGKLFSKALIILKSFIKRLFELKKLNQYDIIFVQRESFMLGTSFFEKVYARSGAKFIFDFDDAIWLLDVSEGNKKFGFLKNPQKTKEIIKMSDLVLAGNQYLAEYASNLNDNVKIVPTTIDTSYHQIIDKSKKKGKICIGWTGTMTTLKHFETIIPVLKKIKAKYPTVYFKLIVNKEVEYPELDLKSTIWQKEIEVEQISELDIGIMPLPDDDWSKGKCGFKGLQYMSLKIPTIMSPVGVNKTIIQDGENGFLAANEEEWLAKLSNLIDDKNLRQEIGKKGRETIVNNYSVEAWKSEYINIFKSLLE